MTSAPQTPYIAPKTNGLAIAALVLGIAALVFGLVPFFGIVLAIVGIVLGAVGLRRPGGQVLAVIGIILSGFAVIANIVVIIIVFTVLPTLGQDYTNTFDDYSYTDDDEDDEQADDGADLDLQTVSTPCFTFEGPSEFINNQSSDKDESCLTTLQGWGEMDEEGVVTYTGVGAIWDQVLVEPVRVSSAEEWAADGELDTFVDYLETNYFPQLGTVISLNEPLTLDGEDAYLTRFDSDAETTVTKATIVVKAPEAYSTLNGDVQFFLVTFVVVDERGDEIIDAAVDSWRWQ